MIEFTFDLHMHSGRLIDYEGANSLEDDRWTGDT